MQVNSSSSVNQITDDKLIKKPEEKKQEAEVKASSLIDDYTRLNPEKKGIPSTIFKSDAEKGNAEKYLDRVSGGAFDQGRSVEDRFLKLKPINMQAMKGDMQLIPPDNNVKSVNLKDLKGVKSYEDLVKAVRASLTTPPPSLPSGGTVINTGGSKRVSPPATLTDAEVDDYIKNNFDAIAQALGGAIPYKGFTSFIGDSNGFQALNDGYGVCTDIHASVTAFRKAFGQEAYLVMTTGSDAAHVFTIFKDNGTWNIQNYNQIVKTSAKTISELYDQAMPEQRKIKIYDVEADGNVKQVTTDHLTATGLAERRFRAESGVGSFDPWTTPEGLMIGSNELSFNKNGFYLGLNPQDQTARTGYYKKSVEGDTQKLTGGAIEAQSYKNANGYETKHIDAKFETEKKWDNADTQVYGRSHFSVFGGVESAPMPLYWQDASDGGTPVAKDPAARLGVSYERNDSKLYGTGPLKFELGDQTKLGATLTLNTKTPLSFDYVGRMYSDLTAESKLVTGAFYQPNRDLTVRAGLATGVDLAKIDGFKDAGEQIKNVVESDAYMDVNYGKGPIAVKAMGIVPLTNPSQYKVGVGVAIAPTDSLTIGATYLNEGIVKDHLDYLNVGLEYKPSKNITMGAGITTPLFGDNAKNISANGFVKMSF